MRRLRLLPLALLLPAAAGCGGSAGSTTAASARLPHALAHAWARRADEVAAAAAAGDGCRARDLASSLRDDVITAEERVPEPYRHTLLASVDRLADGIPCTPPVQTVTTVAPPPEKHGKGPGKGHDKGKSHGHGRGNGGEEGNG